MNDKAKHTPGAVRAAKRFCTEMRLVNTQSEEKLARIIDEETGVAGLLEALKEAYPGAPPKGHGAHNAYCTKLRGAPECNCMIGRARLAIARAERGE